MIFNYRYCLSFFILQQYKIKILKINKMAKVIAVHTAIALVEPINELFNENLPGIKLNHIVDDSLIQEVIASNKVTNEVRKRLLNYLESQDLSFIVLLNTYTVKS